VVDSLAKPDGAGGGAWQALLGYLNFSEGKPEARFQRQLADACQSLASADDPVAALAQQLRTHLAALHTAGAGGFQNIRQAETVLALVFDRLLPAYRRHHADLLAHLSDRELFTPFFLARAFETVLALGPAADDPARAAKDALQRLNDFVGYRPIPVLESRPRGEPYDHERVRPLPLFLRGAGVAPGIYHDLVVVALGLLGRTPPELLAEAQFDPALLDELALDPRAYDHGHPVNRRPNYVFGEWDPHHLDLQGRYRRFVVRKVTLDALLHRVERPESRDAAEVLFEAAAVLAGTVLMASGISGSGPASHDSTVNLENLTKRIARYRDEFYNRLLQQVGGRHGDRLRQEATNSRQPFSAARQHLNQYLARHRAAQQQQRHLALLFADMGHADASREEAARIPTPAVRLLGEITIGLSLGQIHADQGELAAAAALLPGIEELLRRAVRCGATVDPWNILGFQGLFPLFNAREDSIRDPRVDELIESVERLLDLYARLQGEAAAAGDATLRQTLARHMQNLADWWDQFATADVSDVRHVRGGEAADAARHVAEALARWHAQGDAATGPAFWRQHAGGFQTPKAYALVVDALLRKEDHRAALGLLMSWLGHGGLVPLEDGVYSFHALALRWLAAVTNLGGEATAAELTARWELVRRFFDHLEANAEDNWDVPALALEAGEDDDEPGEDDPYRAAYEDVTYQDSADDGEEGAVAEGPPPARDFDLEEQAEPLQKQLQFLSTVARLWEAAGRWCAARRPADPARAEVLAAWRSRARENLNRLLALMDAVQEVAVPEPLGSFDSLVEYDRRQVVREQLLDAAIGTCLDTTLAVRALTGALEPPGRSTRAEEVTGGPAPNPALPSWEPWMVRLELALLRGNAAEARQTLPRFVKVFQAEPLLFVPLSAGGLPGPVLRARVAQAVLQTLVESLPRLCLLRETYHLLQTARAMEEAQTARSRKVTEFDRLFHLAFQGVVESLVESAAAWPAEAAGDAQLTEALEALTQPFLRLWVEHSRSIQLSSLERVSTTHEWDRLREFIARHGRDLFHPRFLTLANLRGILQRGVGAYLDHLRDEPDPLHPIRTLDELVEPGRRDEVVRHLELILRALVENYEEFKDYNTTTTQSDYGENLHVLLDFLRLKAGYERHAWQFRPLAQAHEVLARKGRAAASQLWEDQFRSFTGELADQHTQELERLEQTHGLRLRTIGDLIDERFVKSLALDRLCVLTGPAMAEARAHTSGPALARFREELRTPSATPTGVGLEVPHWLRRLQREVQRVRTERGAITGPVRNHFAVPRLPMSPAQFQRQLGEWEKPPEVE
jgi:hypothetical protein